METKYSKGEKVWVQYGNEEPEQRTISEIYTNRIGIRMFCFEETGEIAIGECYVKKTINGKTKSISQLLDEVGVEEDVQIHFNTTTMGRNMFSKYSPITSQMAEVYTGSSFFVPDYEMLMWLKDFIGDKVFVDIGCGNGNVISQLNVYGTKVIGIEPLFNYSLYLKQCSLTGKNPLHIFPKQIEEMASFISGLQADKTIYAFCRPCHSEFVEAGIDIIPSGSEILYITVPENMTKYNDLGKYKYLAKQVVHEGSSEEKEVVFLIIKP